MPGIFSPETVRHQSQAQDRGKLSEISSHELIQNDGEFLSFDDVKRIGAWYLQQKFGTVLTSDKPLPLQLRSSIFLGKVAFGTKPEDQFPVTVESISNNGVLDLRYHIVPIHYGALELSQHSTPSDSLLALASAAAIAPQFYFSLRGGLRTEECATKKDLVTDLRPDHGSPLVVAFDHFNNSTATLSAVSEVTQNRLVSIRQAGHLHGQTQKGTEKVAQAGGNSKIAAGVSVVSHLRSQLPRHALFFSTQLDHLGQSQVISLQESLFKIVAPDTLALLSASLGFTAEIVGNERREQLIERIFTPENAELPLSQLREIQ